jgi:hypothetical protein
VKVTLLSIQLNTIKPLPQVDLGSSGIKPKNKNPTRSAVRSKRAALEIASKKAVLGLKKNSIKN